jgi:excisionase family DNA binding protein
MSKQVELNEFISLLEQEVEQFSTRLKRRIEEMPDQEIDNLSLLVSPSEAMEMLGISKPTLYKYTENGILKRYKLGGKNYYRKDEIEKAIVNF